MPGDGRYDDNKPTFTDKFYLELEVRRSAIFWRDNRAFDSGLRDGPVLHFGN